MWLLLLVLTEAGLHAAPNQVTDVSPDRSVANEDTQLRTCREGLLDPKSRPEERARWAELLYSYEGAPAKALIIDLLGNSAFPDVQRALCGVLAERAGREPERLAPGLVEPLSELLGAAAEDLRSLAGRILADFPGTDVPERLGRLAAEPKEPLAKRLAAIDALARNTHRRDVVGQLVGLLDGDAPDIAASVVAALESTTPGTYGSDLVRWKRWWAEKSRLSEEVWSAEQLRLYRDRARKIATEFAQFREDTKHEKIALTDRISAMERELFRTLGGDERDAKLVEWLRDPLDIVRRTALSIVGARIPDEGKRPQGEVLTALLDVFREGPAPLRREVLAIAQNLKDADVLDALLARLTLEEDIQTRLAIFRAIGKLDQPKAIPALVREIASMDSFPECVREASMALGSVAAKASDEMELQQAVDALKTRYGAMGSDDGRMRAALLTAMAGIGNVAFRAEFLEGVESSDPLLLRPAIRGLISLKDATKLPRLRTLTHHDDAQVRLAATGAVGELGREEVDLENLVVRLNPTVETNERTRDAAWNGFLHQMESRSIADRIAAAERLRELPDFEVRFLEKLADGVAASNGESKFLETVLDRLTVTLVAQHRYTEAVPRLRALCELKSSDGEPSALPCGLRLLDAVLRDSVTTGVSDLIRQLAAGVPSERDRVELVSRISAYLESEHALSNTERLRALLVDLRSIPSGELGKSWQDTLDSVEQQLKASDKTKTSDTSQSQSP
jgi:HEAT repeat protein